VQTAMPGGLHARLCHTIFCSNLTKGTSTGAS